jgi:ATP-dependent DNA ligase
MTAPKRKNILLAYPAEDKRLDKFPATFLAQRKLRGVRCMTRWVEGIPILLSSYGIPFQYMEHIQAALMELPAGIPWDGELYVHGWSQERINSATKRKVNENEESILLEYHIFDIWAQPLQESRSKSLQLLLDKVQHPLYLVETFETNKKEWISLCSRFLQEGYEGIVLRHPQGIYVSRDPAYRSPHLLKYKPTETDAYAIVGYKEGEGWAKGMLGAFLVTSGEDKFYVGTGPALTKASRASLWLQRDSLVGRTLLVKHEPIETVGGIPICTVAVEVE